LAYPPADAVKNRQLLDVLINVNENGLPANDVTANLHHIGSLLDNLVLAHIEAAAKLYCVA
jgi:hypothetical protein